MPLRRRLLPLCRRYCTASPPAPLLRDYLSDRLYHPNAGYFTRRAGAVGVLRQPLPLGHLANRAEYLGLVERAYADAQTAWFTPVELFQPLYARAVARWVLAQHVQHAGAPLRLYELGGGSGTAARGVLDALRELAPAVYAETVYTGVEISAELAAKQLAAAAAGGHEQRFVSHRRDATARAGWGPADTAPCVFLALEVLDNLPHDRLVRRDGVWLETRVTGMQPPSAPLPAPLQRKGGEAGRLAAAAARAAASVEQEGERLALVEAPLSDPLMARCLALWQAHEAAEGRRPLRRMQAAVSRLMGAREAAERIAFLPTGWLRLLETLAEARPAFRLLAADFDALPNVRVPGLRAPLVASQRPGVTLDHTLLVPRGEADIFFPTDFELAQAMLRQVGGRASRVLPSGAWLAEALGPELRRARAASGFNPLVSEFPNTRVLLTDV